MPPKRPERNSKRKRRSSGMHTGTELEAAGTTITGSTSNKMQRTKSNSISKKKRTMPKPDPLQSNEHCVNDATLIDIESKYLQAENANVTEEDDEEAWLDALEKGDLDDYGELKKEKDPNLMTARQKALKERTGISSKSFANVTLIGENTKVHVITEEAQKRKEEKNKRRKLQAVKKAEESQKLTIERLVKQQGTRSTKDRQKKTTGNNNESRPTPALQQTVVKQAPMIRYVSKGNLLTLSIPENMELPIKPLKVITLATKPNCVVCGKLKKYNSSRTKLPLCSLECYKVDIDRHSV